MLVNGSVGLCNLGNTCYMNSALQLLFSVNFLRDYFTSGRFKKHVNETAWKTKGNLAKQYADLCAQM